MTVPRPTLDATDQPDGAARIDAVVLAVFVAIAVAGLFVVLMAPTEAIAWSRPAPTLDTRKWQRPRRRLSALDLCPGGA